MKPEDVHAQFGPAQAKADSVSAYFRARGLTVEQTTAASLKVTGAPAAFEQVFQTSLHRFAVPPVNGAPARTYHAPVQQPVIPAEIAPSVGAVLGLSTKPAFHSNRRRSAAILANGRANQPSLATGNQPQYLTVKDFAALYDVNPLYNKGITGKGRTLGIITLAAFTPSDAFSYWNSLGLSVNSNRITVVDIDGGPGVPSDASGSDETTLDVEQAGGVAPGAAIWVYQAPNTDQGFYDAFAAAINSNKADSISVSWGSTEIFDALTTIAGQT